MRAMNVLTAMALMVTVSVVPGWGDRHSAGEEVKEALLGFYQNVFNAHSTDAIDQFAADEIVDHNPDPGQKPGKEGLKEAFGNLFTAFPDLHVEVLQVVTEGDTAAARSILSGTQKGEFMGMPPSGLSFKVQLMDFVRAKDGKIVERWGIMDVSAMMQQLTPPAPAPQAKP